MDCSPPGSLVHRDTSGKNTGLGSHTLLQRIFPTQGWNPGLLYCRKILNHLSHQGSPRILEWVAYLSDPGIEPGSPALQADSLPAELSGKPRGTLIPRAVLAPDVFKLLTLLTPMFTCRSLALLLPESSCSSWRAVRTPGHPQVKQVTQGVSGRGGLVCWWEIQGRGMETRAWISVLSPERCSAWSVPWS